MRKFALATAAAAAMLFTAPAFTGVTTPAEAQTVVKKKVVIKHGDRGRHMGRYGDRGRHMVRAITAARRSWSSSGRRSSRQQDRDQEEDHRALTCADLRRTRRPRETGAALLCPRHEVSLVLEFPLSETSGPGDIVMSKRLVLSACAVVLLSASALAKPGVATTTVNLRAEANTTSEVLAKIPAGGRLDVGDCNDGWCAVTFQGKSGFAIQTALDASGRPRRLRPPRAAARRRSGRRLRAGRAGLSAVPGRAARGVWAGAVLRAGTLFLWTGAVLARRVWVSGRLAEVVRGRAVTHSIVSQRSASFLRRRTSPVLGSPGDARLFPVTRARRTLCRASRSPRLMTRSFSSPPAYLISRLRHAAGSSNAPAQIPRLAARASRSAAA